MSEEISYNPFTLGKVFTSNHFPKKILEILEYSNKKSDNYLMISNKQDNNSSRIFPIENSEIIKITMEIEGLGKIVYGPILLQRIGYVFEKNNVKSIYTTGMTVTKNEQLGLESYTNTSKLEIPENQLKEEILNISGIKKVNLEKIVAQE